MSSRLQASRDFPKFKLALGVIAIILAASLSPLNGWSQTLLKGVTGRSRHVPPIHADAKAESDNAHYLGLIILSPRHGDKCHERRIDNRTGAVRSEGLVDCDVFPSLKQLRERGHKLNVKHPGVIGGAF